MCSAFATWREPWNMTCSKRWAKPVLPWTSCLEPTSYQRLTATTGARWSSATMTRRPLSRRWSLNATSGTVMGTNHLGVGLFVDVRWAAGRRPQSSQPRWRHSTPPCAALPPGPSRGPRRRRRPRSRPSRRPFGCPRPRIAAQNWRRACSRLTRPPHSGRRTRIRVEGRRIHGQEDGSEGDGDGDPDHAEGPPLGDLARADVADAGPVRVAGRLQVLDLHVNSGSFVDSGPMMLHDGIRRLASSLALAAVTLLLVPGLVLGHAELDTPTPADKSTVTEPVAEVSGTFSEAMKVDGSKPRRRRTRTGRRWPRADAIHRTTTRAWSRRPRRRSGRAAIASNGRRTRRRRRDRQRRSGGSRSRWHRPRRRRPVVTAAPSASAAPSAAPTPVPATPIPSVAPTPTPSADGSDTAERQRRRPADHRGAHRPRRRRGLPPDPTQPTSRPGMIRGGRSSVASLLAARIAGALASSAPRRSPSPSPPRPPPTPSTRPTPAGCRWRSTSSARPSPSACRSCSSSSATSARRHPT